MIGLYDEPLTELVAFERVNRGAEVCDRMMPGWFERINTDELDISSCHDCVVGQLLGDYCYEADIVVDFIATTVNVDGEPSQLDVMVEHGFSTMGPRDSLFEDMRLLTRTWVDAIEKRRADAGTMA